MQSLLRERHIGAVVKLRGGSLYDAIDRCLKAGLIEPVDRHRSGARPERTVYTVTESGAHTLNTLIRRYVGTVQPEFPAFTAGLAHLLHLDPGEAVGLLNDRRRSLTALLAETEAALIEARRAGVPRSALLETEYTQLSRHAEITWLAQVTQAIEDGDVPWIDATAQKEE
jgi:DNA-binding PadR family transcriptional regulator